jgi:hypothetical protein
VLHRMPLGFKQPEHLVALALLDRGGLCPPCLVGGPAEPPTDQSGEPHIAISSIPGICVAGDYIAGNTLRYDSPRRVLAPASRRGR